MRRSWMWVAAAVLLVVAGGFRPAGADPGTGVFAAWEMDEDPGDPVLRDAGPNGLDGTIGSSVDTALPSAHSWDTVAPDSSPLDPGRLDLVPHDPALNPDAERFAVLVRLRTTSPQANVVQKGQSATSGGFFKIDMGDGRVACLFKGAQGTLHVRSAQRIDDGDWTDVHCERSAGSLSLRIDGVLVDRRDGSTGTVANTWPLSIAGKWSCDQGSVGCDYFSGALDRVLVARAEGVDTMGTVSPPTSTVPPTTTPTIAPTTTSTTTTVKPKPATTTTVKPKPTPSTTKVVK